MIVAVDGKPVTDTRDLINATAAVKPGARAEVAILREGREMKVSVEVGRRPLIRAAEGQR